MEVEFSADFIAFRPKDARKGNGSMLLEVPNRGIHAFLLSSTAATGIWRTTQGTHGYCAWFHHRKPRVAMGRRWPGRLRFFAPIAEENGKSITGLLRGDLMPSKVMAEIPLGHLIQGKIGGVEYPVAIPGDPRNTLTVRDSR